MSETDLDPIEEDFCRKMASRLYRELKSKGKDSAKDSFISGDKMYRMTLTVVLPFKPDYAVPPGETIRELMHEKGIDVDRMADVFHTTSGDIESILRGAKPLTGDFVWILIQFIGGTIEFWAEREQKYLDDLERLGLERPK